MEQGAPIVLDPYTAHSTVEFADELWKHMDVLTPDKFQAKLDQYNPPDLEPSLQVNLEPFPTSKETCCDFLNRLLRQVRRT
jgi:hypothetical protein